MPLRRAADNRGEGVHVLGFQLCLLLYLLLYAALKHHRGYDYMHNDVLHTCIPNRDGSYAASFYEFTM